MLIYCLCENTPEVFKIFHSLCLYLIQLGSVIYRFSSNKCPRLLFILKQWGAELTAGWHSNQGDAYFKVRGTFHKNFQNSVNFSFQVTINSYNYDI